MTTNLILTAQPNLVVAHRAADNGDFVFVMCKEGVEYAMGKRVDLKRPFLVKASIEFVGYLDEMKEKNPND